MYEIPKSAKGGANSSHESAGHVKDKYADQVGLGAGVKFVTGSADAPGTDRGFCAKRDTMEGLNPQNQHEVVNPEYTRSVVMGGQVKFPDEP